MDLPSTSRLPPPAHKGKGKRKDEDRDDDSDAELHRTALLDDTLFIHGRVDPAREESILLVDSMPALNKHPAPAAFPFSSPPSTMAASLPVQAQDARPPKGRSLMSLPSEIIGHILTFLDPLDLISAAETCRLMSVLAMSDLNWQRHVQDNVPGVTLTSSYPCKSYKELYRAHDPHWFLSKYKIWFSDFALTGRIIVTRYDPRRGCIEGYRLVAERALPVFETWESDDEVVIHSFHPTCRLHMDQPVLQLDAAAELVRDTASSSATQRFSAEKPMLITETTRHDIYSNFILTRPVQDHPSMQLWPPQTIPAPHRVRNASQEAFVGSGHKPQRRSEVSDQTFRIRQWIKMSAGQYARPINLGEEVYTYGTLDPRLYTPTPDKPYRGIWVGDYSGHGCEFLLMHQPDDDEPFDVSTIPKRDDETAAAWAERTREERVNRGSIQAIKLTGDANVPRGEYTFIAEDIGEAGYIRTAQEDMFRGARIVKSLGQVATRNFRNAKFIESQLIMISPNRLAQYWVGFGHISFFERVDLDRFLVPS